MIWDFLFGAWFGGAFVIGLIWLDERGWLS